MYRCALLWLSKRGFYSRTHIVGEYETFKEERDVLEEGVGKIDGNVTWRSFAYYVDK